MLSQVEHRLVSLEGWEEELKIAAVSLTHLPQHKSHRKPCRGSSYRHRCLPFISADQILNVKRPLSSCSAAFNKEPLVVTTRSSTSLPKKVQRRGAWKPGISKCWLCGLGSINGCTEKRKKLSRTTRAKHPWPPLNHPPHHRPLRLMYTLHSFPEDFFLNIFLLLLFVPAWHHVQRISVMRIGFLWRLLKII